MWQSHWSRFFLATVTFGFHLWICLDMAHPALFEVAALCVYASVKSDWRGGPNVAMCGVLRSSPLPCLTAICHQRFVWPGLKVKPHKAACWVNVRFSCVVATRKSDGPLAPPPPHKNVQNKSMDIHLQELFVLNIHQEDDVPIRIGTQSLVWCIFFLWPLLFSEMPNSTQCISIFGFFLLQIYRSFFQNAVVIKQHACRLLFLLEFGFFASSIFHLTAISFERWVQSSRLNTNLVFAGISFEMVDFQVACLFATRRLKKPSQF